MVFGFGFHLMTKNISFKMNNYKKIVGGVEYVKKDF